MCMSITNMKFLCLTLWQGEVCTDNNTNDNDANDDGQSMIEKGSLVDKPIEPKIQSIPGKLPTIWSLASTYRTTHLPQ